MPQPPPNRPAAGGAPSNRPPAARPAGSPPSQRVPAAQPPPSQRVPAAPPSQRAPAAVPAKPAGSPPTQRVQTAAPAARPAPASQKVAAVAPGTQRISKAPAPGSAAAPAGPPSTKSKTLKPPAPSPVPPAEKKKMGRGKLMFNLSIYLSIPICIAIIAYGFWKKGAKGLVKGVKGAVTNVGDKPGNQGPQVTDEQKELDLVEDLRKKASVKYAVANLEKTTQEEKKKLFQEVLEFDNEYRVRIQKFIDDPRYQDPDHEYISAGLSEVNMRRRVVTDYLRGFEVQKEEKPAEANARALGCIKAWNGTTQKLALLFLGKDISPADIKSTSGEFAQGLGRVSLAGGSLELTALPAEPGRIKMTGTVKDEFDKLDEAGKKAKCDALAKGVEFFEGTKFGESFGYLFNLEGYYYLDQFAKAKVQVRDARGVGSFKEYYDLIVQAIGTPSKGWEKTEGIPCEWKFAWHKDGTVYRLNVIGTKNGMDLTLFAYNEANWKALSESWGEKDAFEEEKLEDWAGDRQPKEIAK